MDHSLQGYKDSATGPDLNNSDGAIQAVRFNLGLAKSVIMLVSFSMLNLTSFSSLPQVLVLREPQEKSLSRIHFLVLSDAHIINVRSGGA